MGRGGEDEGKGGEGVEEGVLPPNNLEPGEVEEEGEMVFCTSREGVEPGDSEALEPEGRRDGEGVEVDVGATGDRVGWMAVAVLLSLPPTTPPPLSLPETVAKRVAKGEGEGLKVRVAPPSEEPLTVGE